MPENEDLPFGHFPLKHRVIAWISQHFFDHVTYTVRHGLLKGMKRKGGLGWMPAFLSPGVMTLENEFWADLDLKGKTVYDVGAFHGLLTLFFASRARQVVCFEPNTQNRARLMDNLKLNEIRNVEVRPVGVGSKRETRRMVGNPLMPGGSTVDPEAAERLVRAGVGTRVEEISIVTLDEETASGLPAPDLIKIDVEGLENEVLCGARRTMETFKPALFIELHGDTMAEKKRKVAEVVDLVWAAGYRDIRHIESGSMITPAETAVAAQGHLYCLPSLEKKPKK